MDTSVSTGTINIAHNPDVSSLWLCSGQAALGITYSYCVVRIAYCVYAAVPATAKRKETAGIKLGANYF